MPGDTTTNPKSRSRGGCANCKKRKRKCDQMRPACLQCQRRKVVCEGYQVKLQWDWGIASRGAFTRAVLPVLPSSGPGRALVAENDPRSPSSTIRTEESEGWNFQNEESRRLFSHFLQSGVHTLYSTSTHSWITDMMADLAAESPAHLAACVALQILQERDSMEKFHLCFESALQVFRSELSLGSGAIRRGTLNAGLLLCTLSIDQGIPWTNHILCMVRLYGLDGDDWPASYFTDSYISQLLEVMGVMDLPRLVIGRQTPALGIWARTRRAQALHHGRIQGGIETVTGVPRTLLDILARDDNALVERDLWQWQGEDNGELLQAHLWDAWRLAGILLVRRQRRQCRLSDASVRDDDDGERCAPSSKHLLWRLVAALEAVRFGLQQVENKHLLVANGTFFPFVIAGTESALLREEPTWLVPLERIREVSPRINPAQNVRTACEILGQAWAELESAVDEVYDLERAIMAWGGELAMF